MKRTLATLSLALLLIPSVSLAAAPDIVGDSQYQLLQQLIVLLEERLAQLVAQLQVQGITIPTIVTSTGTVITGGGGGGSHHSGGGGGRTSLELSMSGTGSDFSVTANQTLDPEEITITPISFPAGYTAPASITLRAGISTGTTTDIEMTKAVDSSAYSADMRARLASGVHFTGIFTLVFPDDLGDAAFDYQAKYEGNGVTRTISLRKASDLTPSISLESSDSNPTSGALVADTTDTSDEYTVFAFDIDATESSDVKLNGVTIGVDSASSTANDIVRQATLTIGGDEYDGDIGTSSIAFNGLTTVVQNGDISTAVLTIELYGQENHFGTNGESLVFTVDSADVSAIDASTSDPAAVSGSIVGNLQSIVLNGSITVESNSTSTSLTYNSETPANSYGTFTLKFDVTAVGDDDVYIPRVIVPTTAASTTLAGVVIDTNVADDAASSTTSVSLSSTADAENANFYVIHSGDTETFTATIAINPTATGIYQVGLDQVRFTTDATTFVGLNTFDVDQTDSNFQTDALNIPNS